MKKVFLSLALVTASAMAAVTFTNLQDRGWQGKRGTSNVGTPKPTEEACWTAMRADAEARKASANYTCINTKAARLTWKADPAVPPVVPPVVVPPPVIPPVVVPTDPPVVVPVDEHQGGMHSGSMPRYDPRTIPSTFPSYSNERIRTTGAEMPRESNAAFRIECTTAAYGRHDPIVYPGRPGAAHLHLFLGNTGINAYSTNESLRNAGNSTCKGGILNRSSYWVPAVIDTRDGAVIQLSKADIYYKQGYAGVRADQIVAPPAGIRVLAGNAARMEPYQHDWQTPVKYSCGNGWQRAIPQNCTSGIMEMNIVFPQCWDGRNLDSPDHISHMAYPSGGCPSSHPVAIPELSYTLLFPIPAGRNTSTWRLASDNYTGGQGGYSGHGDWMNAWRPEISEQFTREILNQGRSSSGNIGRGQDLH